MTDEGKFSGFWFFVLILGIVWLLTDLGYIRVDIPWLPILLIAVALSAFINRLRGRDKKS